MGYNTDFWGTVSIEPPLSAAEVSALNAFAREDHRDNPDAPGYYCQWVPTHDGTQLEYDGGEKFYDSVEWMEYLINTFLAPAGHVVNGIINAQGEDGDDRWRLVVKHNKVEKQEAMTVWPASEEENDW